MRNMMFALAIATVAAIGSSSTASAFQCTPVGSTQGGIDCRDANNGLLGPLITGGHATPYGAPVYGNTIGRPYTIGTPYAIGAPAAIPGMIGQAMRGMMQRRRQVVRYNCFINGRFVGQAPSPQQCPRPRPQPQVQWGQARMGYGGYGQQQRPVLPVQPVNVPSRPGVASVVGGGTCRFSMDGPMHGAQGYFYGGLCHMLPPQ